jgi:hypothetical protein
MVEYKQKNRRCRGAKFSEYRLEQLVRCFAEDMTVREASATTGFSEPTVRTHFMRLRQHLFDYGFMRVARAPSENHIPARIIFAKKHRGVPEKYAHLYESEFLHRAFFTKNAKMVKRFSANNKTHIEAVRKFVNYNRSIKKYDILEVMNNTKGENGSPEICEFDIMDFERDSYILVNEININPSEAFFRYIWGMLLKVPL